MADDAHKQPVTISRSDLHKRVWEVPMARLAAEYGITGNGLAKICDRLKIPYPSRGYWAKRAAGKAAVQYRLLEPDEKTPLEVTITPTPQPLPPPKLPTELQATLVAARTENSTISVPARLVRPHRIIAEWLAEHERKKDEAKREHEPWRRKMMQPAEFTPVDRRRHRFLDVLFKALETQGLKVKVDEHRTVYFDSQKERIDYELREKQKQVRRPLTDDEKRWRFNPDRPWRQELQPSGILQFSLKTRLVDGMPRDWIDKPDKPIEDHLSDIVAVLALAGPILAEQRREREAAERLRREEEHRRYLEEQRQKQDYNRWRRFLEFADQWSKAERARQFLAALEGKEQPDGFAFDGRVPADWFAWAREWLEVFDPLNRKPEAIYEELAEVDSWTYHGKSDF
jgi:hypothetical protein